MRAPLTNARCRKLSVNGRPEHRAWWGSNQWGYVGHIADAQRYSLNEALEVFLATVPARRDHAVNDIPVRFDRFFITSLTLPAKEMGAVVRDHWAVENALHWVMDMVFRDDECRLRTEHAPANFTTIKHIALNLIRRAKTSDSIRLRRKVAAWDDDFLVSLITN